MIYAYIREFYHETSLGGFAEIGKRLPLFDKLIWITSVAICCFMSGYLILSSLLKFYDDPTIKSVSMEMRGDQYYMLAVTVCRSNPLNESKLQEVLESTWGHMADKETEEHYRQFLRNVTNFSYNNVEAFSHFENINDSLLQGYRNLTYKVANDITLDTPTSMSFGYGDSSTFGYVVSDFGLCWCWKCHYGHSKDWRVNELTPQVVESTNTEYVTNVVSCGVNKANIYSYSGVENIDHNIINTTELESEDALRYYTETQIKQLEKDDKVYIHKPVDLPNYLRPDWIIDGYNSPMLYQKTHRHEADESIKELSISQRKCRYSHENNLKIFPWYTYEACMMQCRHNLAIKLCSCVPYVYPTSETDVKTCRLPGLLCLSKYKDQLLKPTKVKGFQCNCLPQCDYVEFSFGAGGKINPTMASSIQSITIKKQDIRPMVYHHTVLFSKLDMLAAFGGTASLFLGSSLLSVVEILYYFTVRLMVSWSKFAIRCISKRSQGKENKIENDAPKISNIIKNTMKEWCELTSFHAVKYIVHPRRFLIERILWFMVFIIFLACGIKVATDTSSSFYSKAVVIQSHISQIPLPLRKPGISICPRLEYTNRSYFQEHGREKYKLMQEYFNGIMYPSTVLGKNHVYLNSSYCIGNPTCPPLENITNILYENARSTPMQQYRCGTKDMAANSKVSICFRPSNYDSETGPCHIMNTYQFTDFVKSLRKIRGAWTFAMFLRKIFRYHIYIHSPVEVPSTNDILHDNLMDKMTNKFEILMAIETTAPGSEIREIPPESRGCRFKEENTLVLHRVYSYTACLAECRTATMVQLCGCRHPMSPDIGNAKICTHAGLKCLEANVAHLLRLSDGGSHKCGCLRDCEETFFKRIKLWDRGIRKDDYIFYQLFLLKTRESYHRIVAQGQLEHFVTVGGIVSLFLGASVMTLLEVPYFLTIRLIVNFYNAIVQWKKIKIKNNVLYHYN